MVRFAPLPPRTMPAAGSRVGFDDVAVTVRSAAAVWVSFTVNARVFDPGPGGTVASGMSEIVGGVLAEETT